LLQLDNESQQCPSHFGSITWNDWETCYSQAKIELYSLFHALKATKVQTISVKNLTIEVNIKYIKGMLNNLDIQPNAAINCWIVGILLFDFTLKHILESRHAGPNGLLHWCHALEDEDEEDSKDVKEWIDKVLLMDVEFGD